MMSGLSGLSALTGISGVAGGAFNPLSLSPLLWIDATRGVYSDAGTTPVVANDPVRQWNDYSGSSRNCSQGTLANRGTYKTNILNSMPGVLFSGSQVMNSTLTRASVSGSSTWYAAVITPIPASANLELFGWVMAGTTFHQWYGSLDTSNKLVGNGYDGSEHRALSLAVVTQTGMSTIFAFGKDRVDAGTPGTNEIYLNGTQQQSIAAGSPTIDSARQFAIGIVAFGANFYLHELLVMDGSPADEQVTATDAYLRSRWGI